MCKQHAIRIAWTIARSIAFLDFRVLRWKFTYDWKCVNTTYRVPLFMPTACFPEGPSPPFTLCSFWRRRQRLEAVVVGKFFWLARYFSNREGSELIGTCRENSVWNMLISWHYFPSSSLLCIILFSMSILIWTLTECFPVHFKYLCKFSIKNITIWHFYSNLSTPAIFLEEMEPMFVIHNISIATDDDIIQFGDYVNIYPVHLSRAIIICGNCLNWLEKTIVSDHIFCQFLVSWFGSSLMATECICEVSWK